VNTYLEVIYDEDSKKILGYKNKRKKPHLSDENWNEIKR
jgi:hypothetical protein